MILLNSNLAKGYEKPTKIHKIIYTLKFFYSFGIKLV